MSWTLIISFRMQFSGTNGTSDHMYTVMISSEHVLIDI